MRAYWALLRGQARSQTSYRLSFGIDLVSNVWATALDVFTVFVLFAVTRTLGGLDLHEALVVTGMSACAFATGDMLVGNIERITLYVRTGRFDAVLVRPLPALPQLVLLDLPLHKLSRAAFGATVYLVALGAADIAWTPGRALLAVIAPVGGVVFFGAVFVVTASVAFWWTESGEFGNAFTYGGRDFTSYPVSVYSGWFRNAFAYGLGFAFVSYYPALALLGKPDPIGLPGWVGWIAPLVALPATGAAALIWRAGIRRYTSTGS
ncbi:ABC-2 type transport system permease protein [Asanoa hainanensis]|uniref:ABC-2 type transport system permease protein n=1 Tax=Asanoa hainanensis TaxID=560556 RepID=A0A239NAZ4_9ACTN|nr:ABC-2 family transporter protein [Asanoa hainanensis]SNT52086.1 ABC-2 type transport system permease protein [Asanoa hainanensis]